MEHVGRYERYKASTNIFLNWLSSFGPSSPSGGSSLSTKRIWERITTAAEQATVVPASVYRHLSSCIRLRYEVTRHYHEPDLGHEFFLQLLVAARRRLAHLVEHTAAAAASPRPDPVQLSNAFDSISIDAGNDEFEEESPAFDDVAWAQHQIPPIDETESGRRQQEEDLLRFRAACFLSDLDDLVEEVMCAWRECSRGDITLIAATGVTNLCIRVSQQIVSKLQLDYPCLDTLDHIFAVVLDFDAIETIRQCHSHLTLTQAIEVVSIAQEASVVRKIPSIVERIARIACLSDDDAQELLLLAFTSFSLGRSGSHSPLSFTRHLLGKEGGLEATQILLQNLTEVILPGRKLRSKPNFFGPTWNERKALADNSRDLTDFLMAQLMPPLLLAARERMRRPLLPFEDELMPLEPLLVDYLESKTPKVGFVFAIHSILLSVLAMQSPQGGCARVGIAGKITLATLEKQIDQALAADRFDLYKTRPNVQLGKSWLELMRMRQTQEFKAPQLMQSLWNPYMTGQHVTMAVYGVGMNVGVHSLDSHAQCRFVLHLYNAFRQVGVVRDPIPVLDLLIDKLSATKMLWVGGRPSQCGFYLKAFLFSWGYSLKTASRLALLFIGSSEEMHAKARTDSLERMSNCRALIAAEPWEMSRSFRCIAKYEFDELSSSHNYRRWARALKEAVANDSLLGINLIVLGDWFLVIWQRLVDGLGLQAIVEKQMQASIGSLHQGRCQDWKHWRESGENLRVCYETFCLQRLLGQCDQNAEFPVSDQEQVQVASRILIESMDEFPDKMFKFWP